VSFPKEWSSKAQPRLSGDPDGGIRIYVDSNEANFIYVFGQTGHGSPSVYQGLKEEKFETASGIEGSLFTGNVDGETRLHLVLNTDEYIGATVSVSDECYSKNQTIIKDVLRSININK
jgi:hypothetical protein